MSKRTDVDRLTIAVAILTATVMCNAITVVILALRSH